MFATWAFVSGGYVSAGTHYVNPGDSIQAAVIVADPGDTVVVRDGTYIENVVVDVANLTLRSENGSASTTVLAVVNTSDVFLVTANSVTITGFTVQNATDSASGIHLNSVHHCTVSGNNASGNYHGIRLDSSSNNTLTGNTANSNNQNGIYLVSSSTNNNLTGNIASNNYAGGVFLYSSNNNTLISNIFVNDGLAVVYSYDNVVKDNIVNGKPLIYFEDLSNATITDDAGQVILVNCNNITVQGKDLSYASGGIELWETDNSSLSNNTASNNNWAGIIIVGSNNTVKDNLASNNHYGIVIYNFDGIVSVNNIIENNTAKNNTVEFYQGEGASPCGIRLSASDNIIRGNRISGNFIGIAVGSGPDGNILVNNNVNCNYVADNIYGVVLINSSYIVVENNTVTNNSRYGIYLEMSTHNNITNNVINNNNECGIELRYSSSNNPIYNNYFDNPNNANDDGNNIWNITKTPGTNIIGGSWLGGNYWSNYAGEDLDGDGLGNTLVPYNSNGEIVNGGDYLPLVLGNFITNIEPTPPSPATLEFYEDVKFTFDYSTNETGGVGIFSIPFTSGSPTPNYTISRSPIYPVGTGSGSAFFTIMHGEVTVKVDQVKFQMISYADQSTLLLEFFIPVEYYFGKPSKYFDTQGGAYPSIGGTHNGTITPFYDIIDITKLYTYPCIGTGGHTESVKIWNSTTGWNVTATWNGYVGDWHNLSFNYSFTLYANETYNYTIRTGSYPQVIHAESKDVTGGRITCSEFVDVNGKRHEGWIPAIRVS